MSYLEEIKQKIDGEMATWDNIAVRHALSYVLNLLKEAEEKLATLSRSTGFESSPCPLCVYDNGKFIRSCGPHTMIQAALQDTADKQVVILNLMKVIRQHEQAKSDAQVVTCTLCGFSTPLYSDDGATPDTTLQDHYAACPARVWVCSLCHKHHAVGITCP